jgi:hypothetical protein
MGLLAPSEHWPPARSNQQIRLEHKSLTADRSPATLSPSSYELIAFYLLGTSLMRLSLKEA